MPVRPMQPRGLHRTEALQALGPHMQPKDSRSNELLLTCQRLEKIENTIFCIQTPEDAEEQKCAYWQCLTATTEGWFQRFCDSGFDAATITQLPDAWLDVAATADPNYPEWLESVYIGWGERCLEDVIARFEDGEAESLVDTAFADFIYDFPRMQALSEAAFLRQKIDRLASERGTHFPHRQPRYGTANAKERMQTALHIPSLFSQQEEWMEKIRGIKFDTIPDCTSIPRGVEARTQLPIFLVVHLFSGRRRATDIHAKLEEFALGKGYRVHSTLLFPFSMAICRQANTLGSALPPCIRLAESLRPFWVPRVKPFQRRDTINLMMRPRSGPDHFGAHCVSLDWMDSPPKN